MVQGEVSPDGKMFSWGLMGEGVTAKAPLPSWLCGSSS